MRLRTWSKKFVDPKIEAAYSATRLEHRVTTMAVSAFVSAFSLVSVTLAVALFQTRLDIIVRSIVLPIIGLSFAGAVLAARFGAFKLFTPPSNKHMNVVMFLMTFFNFLCIVIVTAIKPGLYAFVSLQLWVNILVITGAGVGHATAGLIAGLLTFFIIMIPFEVFAPIPWILRMLALGVFVVLYCSFTQSRQR